MSVQEKYLYDGPIYVDDCLAAERWVRGTYACSPQKAMSNLKHAVKEEVLWGRKAFIALPGKLIKI